jgi:hypothetical protein
MRLPDRPFVHRSLGVAETIRRAQRAAVAFGATTDGTETERLQTAHELMCADGQLIVDLTLVTQVFDAHARLDDDWNSVVAEQTATSLRDASARFVRMVTRSLEAHARDTGYEIEAWIDESIDGTQALLFDVTDWPFDSGVVKPPRIAREASSSLFRAIAASLNDRMAVPGNLSSALAGGTALFMIARSTSEQAQAV